jgi:RNA-directed DNA polymerase
VAETTADPNSYGVRPTRRGAEAIAQGCKGLRQKSSATWIVEGAIQGCFEHLRFAWSEAHMPRNKRLWSQW